MTPTQRDAALRLADALPGGQLYMRPWAAEAAALLRKLASEPHYTITWDAQGRRLVNGELAPEHRTAEPVQEPVACQYAKDVAMPEHRCAVKCQYEAYQQCQPLTEEQILTAAGRLPGWLRHHEELDCDDLIDFARAVERMHGIKETP